MKCVVQERRVEGKGKIVKEDESMENIKQTSLLERTGVFDEETKRRFELTLVYKGIKGKKILVIGMNPASSNIQVFDNTTNYLLNNLGMMGYSEITIWNLFADICTKLKPSDVKDNKENMEHLKELLKRKNDTILIGYGNTFQGNRRVNEVKAQLHVLLKPYEKIIYELEDEKGEYSKLKTIHPLFAGQRFSGEWKMRKYNFPKTKNK